MDFILEKIGYTPDETSIAEKISSIRKDLHNWKNSTVLSDCLSFIDLTTLNNTDTPASVAQLVERVNQFTPLFPEYPLPAAICVYPNFVQTVKQVLTAPGVRIASVAGGFPFSQTFTKIKEIEVNMAVDSGADEIDIVLPLGHFIEGDYEYCRDEIRSIKRCTNGALLKVIIESGSLPDLNKIATAAFISMEAGADFVKTSTGKSGTGATLEAAFVICEVIKRYFEITGEKRGFKASGGVASVDDALSYYGVVQEVLGTQWLNKDLFRFGASRLANNLLSEMMKQKVSYF